MLGIPWVLQENGALELTLGLGKRFFVGGSPAWNPARQVHVCVAFSSLNLTLGITSPPNRDCGQTSTLLQRQDQRMLFGDSETAFLDGFLLHRIPLLQFGREEKISTLTRTSRTRTFAEDLRPFHYRTSV